MEVADAGVLGRVNGRAETGVCGLSVAETGVSGRGEYWAVGVARNRAVWGRGGDSGILGVIAIGVGG